MAPVLFDASSRLKMQDQMPGVKNAGPENQHRKMEDQRLEADYLISLPGICEIISFIHVLCSGNLRDCELVLPRVGVVSRISTRQRCYPGLVKCERHFS